MIFGEEVLGPRRRSKVAHHPQLIRAPRTAEAPASPSAPSPAAPVAGAGRPAAQN